MIDTFSHNYKHARDAFREASSRLGARVEQYAVDVGTEQGVTLFVDVTVVGATNPQWSVVVSSGVHGIEGFLGSAVQISCLRKLSLDDLAQTNGQFIFIHSLNPYGFAYLGRRVNEENVDLNKIFFFPARPTMAQPKAMSA